MAEIKKQPVSLFPFAGFCNAVFNPIRSISTATWKTFGALSTARIIRIGIGMVSSVLWARYVSQETYGQYQLISSLLAIVSGYCLSGLGQSLTISAAKAYDGNLSRIAGLKTLATLGGSIALGGFAYYYSETQPAVSTGLLIAACIFPFYELQHIWVSWFSGQGRLSLLAGLKISGNLIAFAALGMLILYDLTQLSYLVIGLMGAISVLSILTVIHIFRTRRNGIENRETITYGFHATAASLLSGLILADKFLINEYLSPESLAVYAIALLFPEQIKYLYSIFNQMFIPHVTSAKDVQAAWSYLKPKLIPLFGLFFLISITGFIAIPVLIPLAFSQKYADAVPFAKWLWLCLGILSPFTFLGNLLFAQQKKMFTYLSYTGYPILVSGLYFFLIPQYGLYGAIAAKILSVGALSLFYTCSFYVYLKRTRLSPE